MNGNVVESLRRCSPMFLIGSLNFSYQKENPEFLDRSRQYYPFLSHGELGGNLEKIIEDEGLDEHTATILL